jgi:tetraacyldisaccharide 4'-kinase
MRAPAFWARPQPDARALLLSPLGALYGAICAAQMARPGARAPLPVICVGNLVAGGAGKTPTALALARLLMQAGEAPAFLSRGYGGRRASGEPVRVDPARHGADEVGDEPLLLARLAPTFVTPDRAAGAQAAARAGASLVIMDDGLQNPSLAKDLRLAVVDGRGGVGNGLCLPAGPLRAPLAAQLAHIDALVMIGEREAGGEAVARAAAAAGRPVLRARIIADADAAARLKGSRVYAFAGLGEPEKFARSLSALGAEVAGLAAFPDHHPYTPGELARVRRSAADMGAVAVTTEKDAARLPPDHGFEVLPISLVFEDEAALASLLQESLARARAALTA